MLGPSLFFSSACQLLCVCSIWYRYSQKVQIFCALSKLDPMFLFCKWLSEDFTLCLPELVPYVSFWSVCLNGPVDVCLGWTRWFFSTSVCLRGLILCLPEQVHDVSFLQVSVWSDQLMSIWTEPTVSFSASVCLRDSIGVCLNWYPTFLFC